MVGESRALNVIYGMADHLGVGEGQMYQRNRVMPVEGRVVSRRREGVMLCER